MSLPPPILGADPLRPPPAVPPAEDDPILNYAAPPPAAEAPGLPIGPAEVSAALVAIADVLAAIRGPHWHVEPAETEVLAAPLARQLSTADSPAAAWWARHTDAVLIAGGAAMIVVPRLWIEYQVLRLRREELRNETARLNAEVPIYGTPGYSPDADYGPAASGSGPGVPLSGQQQGPGTRPTDPQALAASLGRVIG